MTAARPPRPSCTPLTTSPSTPRGDLYIVDGANNRIQEVAASTGTQWGQSMTANDIYTVAGSSSGNSGHSGDGGAATSALLNSPGGITFDSAGNLYFSDYVNNRVQEVAAATGTQWGQSMTAGDIYTVVGSSSGSAGHSGDGGAATSALLQRTLRHRLRLERQPLHRRPIQQPDPRGGGQPRPPTGASP